MKHSINAIFILYIVICLFGCTNKKTNDFSVIKIDADNARPFNQVDLINSIELVQLETNSNSVISRCDRIQEYKNRYYILDLDQRAVFVFNKQGDFIFSTKKHIGKGPGEYYSLVDFNINEFNREIELLDASGHKLVVYDLNGKLVRSISLTPELLPLGHFTTITEDIYMFYSKAGHKRAESIVFYSFEKQKIIKKTGIISNNYLYFSTLNDIPFRRINDQLYFNYTVPSNITYLVDKEKLNIRKILEFDFGKYNFLIDDLPKTKEKAFYRKFISNNYAKYALLFNIVEDEANMFIHFYLQEKPYFAKINKINNETEVFYSKYGKIGQLPPPNFINNDVLIYFCEPDELEYFITNELLDNASKEIVAKNDSDNNPVIIKYKLKKN